MEDSKELEELHMSGIEMAATGKETRRAPRPLSPKGQMENAQGLNILCPKNSPGKNTAVGSHSLLQGLFPTQGSNLGLQHCRHSLMSEPPGKPLSPIGCAGGKGRGGGWMGGAHWEDKKSSLHVGLLLKQEPLLSKVISGGQWTPSLSPP